MVSQFSFSGLNLELLDKGGTGGRARTHGIRDDNIQPPQLLNALLNQPHAIGFEPHIPTQRKSLDPILPLNRLDNLLCGRLAGDVVDDDVRAFFGEFVADEGA